MGPSTDTTAGPVFVDGSGRRRRLIKRIGVTVALLCLGYGALLVVLAVSGVRVDAPGLPLIEHAPTPAARPPANPQDIPRVTTESVVAPTPTPTARPTPEAVRATPSPSAVATRAAQPSPVTQVHRTAAASPSAHASASAHASPSAAATTKPRGKSATSSGTAKRATPTRGKSSTAPGAARRTTH